MAHKPKDPPGAPPATSHQRQPMLSLTLADPAGWPISAVA